MQEFVASPLFKVVVGIAIALAVLQLARKLFLKSGPGPLHLRVRCAICGWTGTVGKHMRKCSKCGSTTLAEIRK